MAVNQLTKDINTTCAYCGVGCGISARVVDPELHLIEIKGREDHPANYGRLCSKGSALGETVSLDGRLLYPKVHGRQVVWSEALDELVSRLQETIEHYGPDSVAVYGSGQLLTEDYYVANKLMKGFIGSANMDTNSRLCMASTVAGQKRAFGSDTVPNTYQDLELANLLVLVGSNTAWCHPVLFQRIRAMKEQRPDMKVVVVDPRRTETCDIADLHLAIKPGSDVLLFNGLLSWLADQDALDQTYIDTYCQGFDQALEAARTSFSDMQQLADACGVEEKALVQFYHWFCETEKTVTAWSQGVNQSAAGTDKVNAMINCHLATGRIGTSGSGPLSLTGQPNAMGGREVGGLANQLAAHMEFTPEDVARVGRFWRAPNMAKSSGKTAVDLFKSIDRGEIRFVWIMGTNPVVSLPDSNRVIKALKKCQTVVVSDCIEHTDTAEFADILLPAAPWSEKDGTVTNSERRISRQRALFPLAGEARPDWWIISEVAGRLGFAEAFDYSGSADIFREHAALSGYENNPEGKIRDFNIAPLARATDSEYDALEPFQWPLSEDKVQGDFDGSRLSSITKPVMPNTESKARFFKEGGVFTQNGRANFIATPVHRPVNTPGKSYPLLLNTGRVRDHWHTMTRTGLSARLNQHTDEPFLAIHPDDAERYRLSDQALCQISSEFGKAVVRVQVSDAQRSGEVFMPMHWTRQHSESGFSGVLVNPVLDPVSKQPDLKFTPVAVEPHHAEQHGVLLTRERLAVRDIDYMTEVRIENGYRYEMAGRNLGQLALFERLKPCQKVEYTDNAVGEWRVAWFSDAELQALWITGPTVSTCDRQWLQSWFCQSASIEEAWWILAGNPPQGEDAGRQVCACFGVGEKTICRAIAEHGFTDPVQVGSHLKAGTNCGSCIPEIRGLIKRG
ncbi:molybdopterin-dependent oxidoreductase [Endozoicomonas sp.]|uniref:molybdopterin-dependent oxidoreductase n=1 Tax=Endozoicomonas sp. TaxID=1892382 RepID=UPI003AF6BA2B